MGWPHGGWTMENSASVVAFLVALAFFILAPVLQAILDSGIKRWYVYPLGLLGLGTLLLAALWPKVSTLVPKLSESASAVASDSRVWLILFLLLFIYGATMSIIGAVKRDKMAQVIEYDMDPFRDALQRWVVPRSIIFPEYRKLNEFLSRYSPEKMRIIVTPDDDEAESFAQDIERGFRNAGWAIERQVPEGPVRPGVSWMHLYNSAVQRDPRTKDSGAIVAEALRSVGIRASGGSSGSSNRKEPDIVELYVGARERGPRAPYSQLGNAREKARESI